MREMVEIIVELIWVVGELLSSLRLVVCTHVRSARDPVGILSIAGTVSSTLVLFRLVEKEGNTKWSGAS